MTDDIWEDDLFNRKEEAMAIVAYIESIIKNPFEREDKKSFTLAIEAEYGMGKSFFVRRLCETLSLNHPVAFVDAWSDDFANEPLVALAATLKNALDPLAVQPATQKPLQDFMIKTSKVAKIVSAGLLRRSAALVIGTSAVEALSELSGLASETRDVLAQGTAGASEEAVKDAFEGVATASLMERRIADFNDARNAVQAMKDSLASLVDALEHNSQLNAPIVIFIDELDRCRPNYALKLLEEIKHLFDVRGLAFILSVNETQLGHSISGAYGSNFDGHRYLRRFIDRRYHLATPPLSALLKALFTQAGIDAQKFFFFQVVRANGRAYQMPLHDLVATYMQAFNLGPRDAFELTDILRTCQALTTRGRLITPYLLPLIIAQMKGLPQGDFPNSWQGESMSYRVPSQMNGAPEEMHFLELARRFKLIAALEPRELERQFEVGEDTIVRCVVQESGFFEYDEPLYALRRYPQLIQAVTRFGSTG